MKWREYPSNQEINFRNFPYFDHNHHTRHEMTLVWSPFAFHEKDKLQIVHHKEEYPTLCFTPHRGNTDCKYIHSNSSITTYKYFSSLS